MERVRAIIIKDHEILLIKRTKGKSIYWVVPGGGVEIGEDHETALKRECMEEVGVEVKVGKLLFENVAEQGEVAGQKIYFYACRITGGVIGTGTGPEFEPDRVQSSGTYEMEWVALEEIERIELKPASLKKLLKDISN